MSLGILEPRSTSQLNIRTLGRTVRTDPLGEILKFFRVHLLFFVSGVCFFGESRILHRVPPIENLDGGNLLFHFGASTFRAFEILLVMF